MKKWLLGIGTFALAFAMLVTPTDSKVMAAGTTVTSGDAGTTVTGGDAGITSENPKVDLSLDDSWVASWTPVEGATQYNVYLYKDGEKIRNAGVKDTQLSMAKYLEGSGTYQYRIYVRCSDTSKSFYSEFSEEKVYVEPEKKLGTTVGYWDTSKLAVFNIPVVEGAYEYELCGYKKNDEGEYESFYRRYLSADSAKNGIIQYDFDDSYLEEKYEGGKMYVIVRALSEDVAAVAHGDCGEKSADYEITWSLDYMTKYINEILGWASGASAEDVLINGKASNLPGVKRISKYNLQAAMAESEDFRNLINDITKKYAEEKGIKEEVPTVSSAASAYIKAEDITVIGAAGNGNAGETVKLQVGISEEEVNIDSSLYKNCIKLDLKLMSNSTAISKLNVPVTIKMKAPAGMDTSKLVILHYHTSGEAPEIIIPVVDGDKITFSVSKFSTFVFAESVSDGDSDTEDGSTGGTDSGSTGGTGAGSASGDDSDGDKSDSDVNKGEAEEEEDDDEDDSEEESAEEAKPVKDNVPKTGDSLPIALPMAMTIIFAGAAVGLRKKDN